MKTSWRFIRFGGQLTLLASILTLLLSGCTSVAPRATDASSNPSGAAVTKTPHEIRSQPFLSKTPSSSGISSVQPFERPTSQATLAPVVDLILQMIRKVDRDEALADLQALTGEESVCNEDGCHTILNRLTGSRELGWAKDYVTGELSELGYSVDLFDWSRSGHADQDVIAKKLGTSLPKEEVYFVAHLDGTKSIWTNQYPAADDNASGVVDLLQLGRVLRDYSFDHTIVLFFSTGEEQGTLGVRSYIDSLTPQELGSIKYVINLDMLGYDANHDWAMELWHGGHAESLALAELMSDTIEDYQLKLVPELAVGCG